MGKIIGGQATIQKSTINPRYLFILNGFIDRILFFASIYHNLSYDGIFNIPIIHAGLIVYNYKKEKLATKWS